jgi:hypothetical protein
MTRYEALVIGAVLLAAATVTWLWPLYVLYVLAALVCLAFLGAAAWFFGMAIAGGWGA